MTALRRLILALMAAGGLSGCDAGEVPDRDLAAEVRADFQARRERPVTVEMPRRDAAGEWRCPGGDAVTWRGVLAWTAPEEMEGVPLTAYYCRGTYWVHEGGGIADYHVWYGPFRLNPTDP
jgi:hypothetical protein